MRDPRATRIRTAATKRAEDLDRVGIF